MGEGTVYSVVEALTEREILVVRGIAGVVLVRLSFLLATEHQITFRARKKVLQEDLAQMQQERVSLTALLRLSGTERAGNCS